MSTAEQIRAEIANAERELENATRQTNERKEERAKAEERQRLRRELDAIRKKAQVQRVAGRSHAFYRRCVDADEFGPHMPSASDGPARVPLQRDVPFASSGRCDVSNCVEAVSKGEYVWKIEGMSWLESTLSQVDEHQIESQIFRIGEEDFCLCYNPTAGRMSYNREGSLAISHESDGGLTFRYKLFIKNSSEDFVQWGEAGDVCFPGLDTEDWVFGPDVTKTGAEHAHPRGIFGLSHRDLVRSEWVVGDTLTVKVEIEVRDAADPESALAPDVEVPPGTLATNLLSLLDDGKCSDVTFIVAGVSLQAHSQILCARSDVFDRQLNGGMRESVSKEVVVQDCDAVSFKAMLQFLYSDDFRCVEKLLQADGDGGAEGNSGDKREARISLLQGVLAVSHKYEVARLRLWCERQLCHSLSVCNVCGVLSQAHLYQAQELEKSCLRFIQVNKAAVVVTQAFGLLAKDWPEIMLKIFTSQAGVTENQAAAAFDAQRQGPSAGKRQRTE